MKNLISKFVQDESGATAIEYGLIAALLSVVIITSLNLASGYMTTIWDKIQSSLAIGAG